MQVEGFTLLTGRVIGTVKTYDDCGAKAVFTLLWRGVRWYVESGEETLVRQAVLLQPDQEVTIVGHLFSRGGKVGVRASKIFD